MQTINSAEEKNKAGGFMRRYYGEEYGDIKRKKPGNSKIETLDDLYNVLRVCWCKESAYPSCQAEWVPNDPSYGQCAITAMLLLP